MNSPLTTFAELDAVLLEGLHPSARTLATSSDPTTATLERLVGEPILTQVEIQAELPLPGPLFRILAIHQQEPVLLQITRLQGARTGRVWQLLASAVTTGRRDRAVIAQLRPRMHTAAEVLADVDPESEQRREPLGWHCGPAGTHGAIFGLDVKAGLVTRTYRVVLGGRPVAQIEEGFPAFAWPDAVGSAAQ